MPFAAGSGTDAVARLAAQLLGQEFPGATFTVESRPGGNGTLGALAVARAATEGGARRRRWGRGGARRHAPGFVRCGGTPRRGRPGPRQTTLVTCSPERIRSDGESPVLMADG